MKRNMNAMVPIPDSSRLKEAIRSIVGLCVAAGRPAQAAGRKEGGTMIS
jgi:hypothetical protein